MSIEDKKETPYKSYMDPFSRMMFGENKMDDNDDNEDEDEDDNHHKEHEQYDWFLGRKMEISEHSPNKNNHNQTWLQQTIQNIDIEELMKHIDTLSNTASQFKPLLKEIKPLFSKWLK